MNRRRFFFAPLAFLPLGAPAATKPVVVSISGDVDLIRMNTEVIAEEIRKMVNERDFVIIDPRSRQAQSLQ